MCSQSVKLPSLPAGKSPVDAYRSPSVSSNEPIDADGDWLVTGDLTLYLRAERSGNDTGRVYTITLQCTDSSGSSTTNSVTVTVPHDQGH
jgi:hypothetical protein